MQIKPGSRWKSAVCDTEVVVVKAPTQPDVSLECGGAAMLAVGTARAAGAAPAAGQDGGSLLGKRYGDDASGLEVLCTKAGGGSLAVEARALVLRAANRLPSSD